MSFEPWRAVLLDRLKTLGLQMAPYLRLERHDILSQKWNVGDHTQLSRRMLKSDVNVEAWHLKL